MGQRKNIVPIQQIDFAKSRNVLPDVVIRHDLQQYWFDALGQFAGSMRVQKGLHAIIKIEDEVGHVNEVGSLVVVAGVANETLQMEFPAGTWDWKDKPLNKSF